MAAMTSKFRQALIAGGALVAAFVVAVAAQPVALDKTDIERAVRQAAGRRFTISGPLRLSLLPVAELRAEAVALANAGGFPSRDLVSAQELRLRVKLLPLLFGRIEVTQAVLERPTVALEVDAQGRAGWAQLFARKLSHPRDKTHTHFRPGLELRIENGTLRFSDARAHRALRLEHIEAVLSVQAAKALADGQFDFRGHTVTVRLSAAPAPALSNAQPFRLDANVKSDLVQVSFAGMIGLNGAAGGALHLSVASLKAAGGWLEVRALQRLDVEPLSLDGTLQGGDRVYRFGGMHMNAGGARIDGDLTADLRGERIGLAGELEADNLVLFQSGHGSAHSPRGARGWSAAPISLNFLRQADAHLTLRLRKLRLGKLDLQSARLEATQESGRLLANFNGVRLYGGSASGTFAVDAGASVPLWSVDANFDDTDLAPFLSAAIGVGNIAGTGTVSIKAAARGASADALMHSLNGTATLALRKGRIEGIDLGAAARTIQSLLNDTVGPGNLTDYETIRADISMADGVLETHDFDLRGPLIQMSGAGTVDLGNRRIDFRLVPRATAAVAGKPLTLGVPFRVQGPWSHVRTKADVGSLADAVARNLAAGRAPFKGVFGPAGQGPKKKKHKSLGDALKNMLGIH